MPLKGLAIRAVPLREFKGVRWGKRVLAWLSSQARFLQARYSIFLLMSLSVFLQNCRKDEEIIPDPIEIESKITHPTKYGESDGAINLTVSGGKSPYSFQWSNDSMSEDLAHLSAGEYRLKVTDATTNTKCDSFVLTQPDPAPLVLSLTGDNVSRHGGNDGAAYADVTGGVLPYSYDWSNGIHEEHISDLVSGSYYLTVTDSELHTSSDSIYISEPGVNDIIINYTASHPSETGASDGKIVTEVSGGFPPYAYLWSTGSIEQDLYNLAAGNYTLSVSDSQQQLTEISILLTDYLTDFDGNSYAIVKIGDQIWMKQNLRVTHAPDGSQIETYSYNDDTANRLVYGSLYSWDIAMNGSIEEQTQGICPCGWHIPTDEEFKKLEIYLGMTRSEADMENTWRGVGIGTALKIGGNSSYDARLAGRRSSSGTYSLLGSFEYVWTSSEFGSNAWRRCLDINSDRVGRWNTFPKTYGFSVRCLKDNE